MKLDIKVLSKQVSYLILMMSIIPAFLVSPFYLKAQNQQRIDSLLKAINGMPDDTTKVKALFKLTQASQEGKDVMVYAIKYLELAEKLDYKKGINGALNTIGHIYYQHNDVIKALDYYQKALKIAEAIKDTEEIAQSYSYFAMVYGNNLTNTNTLYDTARSLKYNLKSLAIWEQLNNQPEISNGFTSIGLYYYNINNNLKALEYFQKSMKILESLEDREGTGNILGLIGSIHMENKDYKKAELTCLQSFQIAKELGDKQSLLNASSCLFEIYQEQDRYKDALSMYILYTHLQDSLTNIETEKSVLKSQMDYEFDKKETLAKAEIEKQKVQKYSFIAGTVLLLALAIVLYNRYRLKQRNNKLLEEKNEMITKSFNDLKKTQGLLVQSEKMASLGQLTAGIAHEINNPINFVSANVKPLKRNYDELVDFVLKKKELNEEDLNYNIVESKQLFSGIEEGAHRTTEIVKGLRNFSRLDENDLKKANMNEGIESTLMLLLNLLTIRKIEVIKSLGNIPQIKCYPGQLNQVFMNVLSNAIDAIGENGKITISTSLENAHVKISITDTGKGMSEEVRQKIFEPFFTTKDVGKGTGLGLSISYGIIEEHKGKIAVQSQTGKGAEFIITLPVS